MKQKQWAKAFSLGRLVGGIGLTVSNELFFILEEDDPNDPPIRHRLLFHLALTDRTNGNGLPESSVTGFQIILPFIQFIVGWIKRGSLE